MISQGSFKLATVRVGEACAALQSGSEIQREEFMVYLLQEAFELADDPYYEEKIGDLLEELRPPNDDDLEECDYDD